jgi:ParB-like chromosome segregation protein Spo0J
VSNLHSSQDDRLSGIERILGEGPVADTIPAREGLPPTFRMRADAHYVELLDSAPPRTRIELLAADTIELRDGASAPAVPALLDSITRHGVLQPLLVQHRNGRYRLIAGHKRLSAARAAGLREVPCIVCHADDDAAAALAAAVNTFADAAEPPVEVPLDATAHERAELARALSAVSACADLLGNPAPALTGTVVLDLLRAELRRAASRLQAMRVGRRDVVLARKPVRTRAVVDRVLQAVEYECRLRGATLETRIDVSDNRIEADDEFLAGALTGLMIATFDLVDPRTPLRVTLRAEAPANGDFTFVVSQDAVGAPAEWRLRAERGSRLGESDEPGEPLALSAARHVVEACGGKLSIAPKRRGTEIRVNIPTIA